MLLQLFKASLDFLIVVCTSSVIVLVGMQTTQAHQINCWSPMLLIPQSQLNLLLFYFIIGK